VSPKVSIGVPVYNGERYLAEAVESALAQTFGDFELLISDNGSTDGTAAIARDLAARDPRIRYLRHEENRGAAWNFNHLVEEATGEYFVWLAHDDAWEPEFLERCVRALDEDPSTVLAFSSVAYIDEAAQPNGARDIRMRTDSANVAHRLWDVLMVWHDCLPVFGVIRTDVLRRTALIRPYASGDHLLLAELAVAGKYALDPDRLFRSRLHAGQSIQTYSIWVDHHAYTRWFEQRSHGRPSKYPQWRLLGALLAIVWRAPMRARDRVGCYLAVGRWSIRYRSLLRKDLTRAWFGRPRTSGAAV